MNRKQRISFWSMTAGFVTTATLFIYLQSGLSHMTAAGLSLLVTFLLICIVSIHRYVQKNPQKVESWFSDPKE